MVGQTMVMFLTVMLLMVTLLMVTLLSVLPGPNLTVEFENLEITQPTDKVSLVG